MTENRRVRILCATDVTERIEMEQKFIQAGKMATLGEMATGVAHELNQPLTVIKGAASYFLRKTRRSEPIAPETLSELSVEISGQVDRASDIINHMRAFGRKSDLALLDTDINGVVAQACDLFGRQLVVHGITLETMLKQLVNKYGWDGLAKRIRINCFKKNPNFKSSLTFLRKTPWARSKVEELYKNSRFWVDL